MGEGQERDASFLRFLAPPFRREQLEIERPIEQVRAAIAAVLAPRVGRRRDGDLFRGEAIANGFRLRRMIDYRNDFRPETICMLEPIGAGTRVTLKMRPAAITMVILCAIYAFALYVCVIMGSSYVAGKIGVDGFAYAIGFAVFLYLLPAVAFEIDARRVTPTLRDAIAAWKDQG
jgi:hypothetical protein